MHQKVREVVVGSRGHGGGRVTAVVGSRGHRFTAVVLLFAGHCPAADAVQADHPSRRESTHHPQCTSLFRDGWVQVKGTSCSYLDQLPGLATWTSFQSLTAAVVLLSAGGEGSEHQAERQ